MIAKTSAQRGAETRARNKKAKEAKSAKDFSKLANAIMTPTRKPKTIRRVREIEDSNTSDQSAKQKKLFQYLYKIASADNELCEYVDITKDDDDRDFDRFQICSNDNRGQTLAEVSCVSSYGYLFVQIYDVGAGSNRGRSYVTIPVVEKQSTTWAEEYFRAFLLSLWHRFANNYDDSEEEE